VVTSWNIGASGSRATRRRNHRAAIFPLYTESRRTNGSRSRPAHRPRTGRYEEEGWRVRRTAPSSGQRHHRPHLRGRQSRRLRQDHRDITERREAQLKLEQMHQQLRIEKLDALGQLTGAWRMISTISCMVISGSLHNAEESGRRRSQEPAGAVGDRCGDQACASLTSQFADIRAAAERQPAVVDVAERIDAVRECSILAVRPARDAAIRRRQGRLAGHGRMSPSSRRRWSNLVINARDAMAARDLSKRRRERIRLSAMASRAVDDEIREI